MLRRKCQEPFRLQQYLGPRTHCLVSWTSESRNPKPEILHPNPKPQRKGLATFWGRELYFSEIYQRWWAGCLAGYKKPCMTPDSLNLGIGLWIPVLMKKSDGNGLGNFCGNWYSIRLHWVDILNPGCAGDLVSTGCLNSFPKNIFGRPHSTENLLIRTLNPKS